MATRTSSGLSRALLPMAVGVGLLYGIRAVVRARRYMDLQDKVVLITGGSRGLGLLMSREFARRGARLAVCARSAEELRRAHDEFASMGDNFLTVQCDLTQPEQIPSLIAQVGAHFGRLDVLINNAGTIVVGPMETMTEEDYHKALALHFWAPFHTIRAALPLLRRSRGRIVNIASIGGKIAMPHLLPYDVSKFALVGFSEGLRAELGREGIYVTTVCPGTMRTGSARNVEVKGNNKAEYAWFVLSDSLPIMSMSARRAARQIVRACQYGQSEVILSLPAKIATKVHGLFPGISADYLGLVNRLLPTATGLGTRSSMGHESESGLTRSWLTSLTRSAEQENNERVE